MNKRIVIMGSAPCLETDMIRLLHGTLDAHLYDFLAVGLDCADRYLGRIEHAVSYHPKEFKEFRERREKAGGNLDYVTHSHSENGPADRIWPYLPPSGSSAMLGVEVALDLGYEKIVVAGVLLEGKEYKRFREGWKIRFAANRGDYAMEIKNGHISEKVVNSLKDQMHRIRAMGGYPLEILGPPTEEWMND